MFYFTVYTWWYLLLFDDITVQQLQCKLDSTDVP